MTQEEADSMVNTTLEELDKKIRHAVPLDKQGQCEVNDYLPIFYIQVRICRAVFLSLIKSANKELGKKHAQSLYDEVTEEALSIISQKH